MRGSVINRVIRASGVGIDVHVISRAETDASTEPPARGAPGALPPRRVALAFAARRDRLAAADAAAHQLRAHLGLPSILLLYLLARRRDLRGRGRLARPRRRGGRLPARELVFTPPEHTFTVSEGENFVALVVFLAVAAVVSGFVALASRRAAEGARARAESEALVRLAGSSSMPTLLETLRRVLGVPRGHVLHRDGIGLGGEASAGIERRCRRTGQDV